MSRRTKGIIGVIGLGIIGRRVSEHLRRQGFSVFVWNRTPRPFPNFVGSPAEIAQLTDFIQIFVSDDAALLDIVQQLKMTLKAHHIVMAHCTVAPHTMREAAEIVQRRGAQFLDAPFTGSRLAAEKGELVYYIGGDESAFRRAKPILAASSKEQIEIGEIGQATTIKVATNMITAATVQVAAEALALVQNAGMDPEKFAAAMRGNASNSVTLTMKLPKMIAEDFDPHFSVKHMLKDVEIASRLARSYGISLGATEAARVSLVEEMRLDRGDYDFTSLVRALIPPKKGPEQPEVRVADHPMLDLKDSVPREEAKPLPKQPTMLPEVLPSVELLPEVKKESFILVPAPEPSLPEPTIAPETKSEGAEEPAAEPIEPEPERTEARDEIVESAPREEEPVRTEKPVALLEDKVSPLPELSVDQPVESVPVVEVRSEQAETPLPEGLAEREDAFPKTRSEPEVDHLILSEPATAEVAAEKRSSLQEMWEDDGTTDSLSKRPTEEAPVASETGSTAREEEVAPEEAAEPEEARRGFFSRLFSKTSHEKDPDY